MCTQNEKQRATHSLDPARPTHSTRLKRTNNGNANHSYACLVQYMYKSIELGLTTLSLPQSLITPHSLHKTSHQGQKSITLGHAYHSHVKPCPIHVPGHKTGLNHSPTQQEPLTPQMKTHNTTRVTKNYPWKRLPLPLKAL